MHKTPDEIKKGLECCMDYQNCTEGEDPQCPYYDAQRCMDALLADALVLIQSLEKGATMDKNINALNNKTLDEQAVYIDQLINSVQQLQYDNAQLNRCIENMTDKLNAMNDEVAKLKAERDAAVEDLESYATVKCFACKYYEEELTEVPCNECKIMGNGNRDMFEWRGVQKD